MPKLYGYIRVSTDEQRRSGLSLASQRRKIEECGKKLRLKVGRVFRDAAVSASRVPLLRRKAGWELDHTAQAGDHIAIAKLDRAFRSLQDFAAMLDRWHRRGLHVHLLDIGVDTDSPVGRMIAGILATVAEWESRRMGERIRDAHDERRRQGRKTNGTVAIGYCAVNKRVRPSPAERDAARQALRFRQRGKSWNEVAAELNRRRVRCRGRGWNDNSAMRWAIAAKMSFPLTGYHGILGNRHRGRRKR